MYKFSVSEVKYKKRNYYFLETNFSNPLCVNSCLYVCHIFQLSQNDGVKNAFLFLKITFSSSYTSRPEKNSAIDGQKKGDVTSPTSSQNSEKHLTEAELKVSITIFYL